MQIPPRAELVNRVRAALAAPFGAPVYLHGAASTGKEATLAAASVGGTLIPVDCVLKHTERLLFSAIVGNGETITSGSALIDALAVERSNASMGLSAKLTVVVLNRAERLASSAFPPSTLSLLAKLPSMARRPDLRIVLVSRVPLSVVRHAHSQLVPHMCAIHFVPLSREEIKKAVTYDPSRVIYKPDAVGSADTALVTKYYQGFAQFVTDILYQSTNNPHHILRVVDAFFPEYLVLLLDKSKRLNPVSAFNRVRDGLTDVLKTLNPTLSSKTVLSSSEPFVAKTGEADVKTANLSCGCRTMLVAAYLGTVVQPGQDTRIFSTERTNRRMMAQKKAANNSVPLERLLAIFHAVSTLDEHTPSFLNPPSIPNFDTTVVSSSISSLDLVHISTLVALGWLVRDGAAHSLSEPKFRCKLSRQDAGLVASTVGIQLEDYLIFDKAA